MLVQAVPMIESGSFDDVPGPFAYLPPCANIKDLVFQTVGAEILGLMSKYEGQCGK